MLRNRKDVEEGHLKGVSRPKSVNPSKIKFGHAQTLQNTIPAGVNSWKKKRGLHYLDFGTAHEVLFPLDCVATTLVDPQALTFYPSDDVLGNLAVIRAQTVLDGGSSGDTMSMSLGLIETGGFTRGQMLNVSKLGVWQQDVHAQGMSFKSTGVITAVETTKASFNGSGSNPALGSYFSYTVKGDEHSAALEGGSGRDLYYLTITDDTTSSWKLFQFAENNWPGGTHCFAYFGGIILKGGNDFFAIGLGSGVNASFEAVRWDFTTPGTRTHYRDLSSSSTIAPLGADLSTSYVICAASDGKIYRLNRADLTTHDSFSVGGNFLQCNGLCAVSDSVYYLMLQSSTHNVTVAQLSWDGVTATLTEIGSLDTNGIIGLQNRLFYALFFVDRYLYWYNADWLGGYSTILRTGPLVCPS